MSQWDQDEKRHDLVCDGKVVQKKSSQVQVKRMGETGGLLALQMSIIVIVLCVVVLLPSIIAPVTSCISTQ